MSTRRRFLSSVGVAMGGSTAGCLSDSFSRSAADSPKTLVGVFPGTTVEMASPWTPVEQWLGRTNAVVTLYFDASSVLRSQTEKIRQKMTRVWQSGHIPLVTWQPYRGGANSTPSTIERAIHTGEYDDVVDRWRRLLDEWVTASGTRRRLYFRPLPEMNGDWLPWSAADGTTTTDDFIAAWRHLHDRIMEMELFSSDIQWVWNPNSTDLEGPPAEAYYPGDEFVDWVGIDGYNFGSSRSWSSWQSPEEVFGSMLNRVRKLTDKPVALPEYGTSSYRNGRPNIEAKSTWIRSMFEFVRRQEVRMACWFNIDKETDWAVFGGTRGPAAFSADDTRYRVYPTYREAVHDAKMVWGGTGRDRVVSDRAFRGWT